MSEGTERTGRCLCGAVRYSATPPWNWVAHCHCESCRRATGSPITTFFAVPKARFAFGSTEPVLFESSPGVRRRFCGTCGTPVSYEYADKSDEIHIYVATLDDDAGLEPQKHDFWNERVHWLSVEDDLPKEVRG